MPNKRFQDMLDDGARMRARRENLAKHPLSAREAICIICDVHLSPDGRPIVGVVPDFMKVDGELYQEAWRVLRRFAG